MRAARHLLLLVLTAAGALLAEAPPSSAQDTQPRVQLGIVQRDAFLPGSYFPLGVTIAVRGSGFAPNELITEDGPAFWYPYWQTPELPYRTDGEGRFPSSTAIIVSERPPGDTLTFHAGETSASVPITIVPRPWSQLETPAVRPGRRVAVRLHHFLGIDGRPQAVALALDDVVAACVQTGATGEGMISALVPETTPAGRVSLGLQTGRTCQTGTSYGPWVPVPAHAVAIDPSAPTLDAPAAITVGTPATVGGGGLGAGQRVTLSLDGAALAETTTDGDGAYTAAVTLPEAASPGDHLLTATSAAGGAAALVTVTAAAPTTGPAPSGRGATPGTPTAPTARAVRLRGTSRLSLTLTGRPGTPATVVVRTRAKVHLTPRGKARVITLARLRTTKRGRVSLTLTRAGASLLRTRPAVRVTVRVTAAGARATTKAATLRTAPPAG